MRISYSPCGRTPILLEVLLLAISTMLAVTSTTHVFAHSAESLKVNEIMDASIPSNIRHIAKTAKTQDLYGRRQMISNNQNRRYLQTRLSIMDRIPDGYKLDICEGNCNNDSDCTDTLRCMKRTKNEPVPGCVEPQAHSSSLSGVNFCYEPQTSDGTSSKTRANDKTDNSGNNQKNNKPPKLVVAGNDGQPASAFPLQKCQGHCDRNKDCDDGLRCFLNSRADPMYATTVPGCSGTRDDMGTQYCFDPRDKEDVNSNNQSTSAQDKTKTDTSIRSSDSPSDVPSSAPVTSTAELVNSTTVATGSTSNETLAVISTNTSKNKPLELKDVGNHGVPKSNYPLGRCKGDCDDDSDCENNLICFHRDLWTDVPGCSGNGVGFSDYCIDPADVEIDESSSTSTATPTLAPVGNTYKTKNKRLPLQDIGNDGRPKASYPLGRCEGDCDGDSECLGDLVCFNRDGWSEVPGCSGYGLGDADYCIDPADDPATAIISSYKGLIFRFKMYWEAGFNWQEEDQERNWCMECFFGNCEVGAAIEIRPCSPMNTYFELVNEEEVDGETLVQIQLTQEANDLQDQKSLCLELVNARVIELQYCDSSEKRQKFKAGAPPTNNNNDAAAVASFDDTKFEIYPAYSDGCVSQRHHPRDYEIIFKADCNQARRTHTNLWNKY